MTSRDHEPLIVPWQWRRVGALALLEARIGPAALYFTSRVGGVSAPPFDSLNLGRSVPDRDANVSENRRRLFDALGIEPSQVAMAQLVHGADTLVIGGRGAHRPEGGLRPAIAPKVDALLTDDPRVVPMLTYADCVPVYLVAPRRRAVAMVHAGWRGLAAGVIGAAVTALQRDLGADADDLWAAVGPCIGPSYQVDEAVMVPMRERHPWADRFQDERGVFDMSGACTAALVDTGIAREKVLVCKERTESPAFFSHRTSRGRTGRMAGIVRLGATTI